MGRPPVWNAGRRHGGSGHVAMVNIDNRTRYTNLVRSAGDTAIQERRLRQLRAGFDESPKDEAIVPRQASRVESALFGTDRVNLQITNNLRPITDTATFPLYGAVYTVRNAVKEDLPADYKGPSVRIAERGNSFDEQPKVLLYGRNTTLSRPATQFRNFAPGGTDRVLFLSQYVDLFRLRVWADQKNQPAESKLMSVPVGTSSGQKTLVAFHKVNPVSKYLPRIVNMYAPVTVYASDETTPYTTNIDLIPDTPGGEWSLGLVNQSGPIYCIHTPDRVVLCP